MDRDGRLAAHGHVNDAMLAKLMRHPYFRRRPPKSTGREEFGPHLLDRIVADARRMNSVDHDLVATVTALTARPIAAAWRQFICPHGPVDQLIVSGGGAQNPTMMKMIGADLPE